MPGKVERRVGELLLIERRFKVQIDAFAAFRDRLRQRGFADLARAEQRHRRDVAQAVLNQSLDAAVNHPCNYGMGWQNCKDDDS
jgi:hypothetical protein